MACIYQALELKDADGKGTGKYHYCVYSDEETWSAYAIGHCAENCPGHSTREEAEHHFREFRYDTTRELMIDSPNEQKRCQVCQEWTTKRAILKDVLWDSYVLCEKHNTDEELRKLFFQPKGSD